MLTAVAMARSTYFTIAGVVFVLMVGGPAIYLFKTMKKKKK